MNEVDDQLSQRLDRAESCALFTFYVVKGF